MPGSASPHFAGGALELATIGLRGAYLAARSPHWRAPDLVVSAGACGALAPELAVGALVMPERCSGPMAGAQATAAAAGRRPPRDAMLTMADVVETAAQSRGSGWRPAPSPWTWSPPRSWPGPPSAACAAWCFGGVSDAAERGVPADLARVVGDDGRVHPMRA